MVRLVLALSILAAGAAVPHERAPKPGLTGAWIFGEGTPEPEAGVVKRERGCYQASVETRLEQKGSQVTGTIRWYPEAQGRMPEFVIQQAEELAGTRAGNRVILTGTYDRRAVPERPRSTERLPPPVHAVHRYVLTYHPKSKHLVGTKDGKPFWAAPVQRIQMKCGPPPP